MNKCCQEADKAGYERGRGEAFREAVDMAWRKQHDDLREELEAKARPTPVPAKKCALFHDHDTDGCGIAQEDESPLVPCCLCPDNHYPDCPRYKAPEPSVKPCEECRMSLEIPFISGSPRPPCPECRPEAKPCRGFVGGLDGDCNNCGETPGNHDAEIVQAQESCDLSHRVGHIPNCPKCRPGGIK